jgi:simple sugar transport system ATP-binding protein
MNVSDTIGVIYNGQFQKIADTKSLTTKEVGEFMMGVKHE